MAIVAWGHRMVRRWVGALLAGALAAAPAGHARDRVEVPGNPADGAAWQALAAERSREGDLRGAIAAMRRAIDLGAMTEADGLVELAGLRMAGGDADAAAADLARALAAGYRQRGRLARDPRFATMPPAQLRGLAGLDTVADPAHGVAAWAADLEFLDGELRRLHPRMRERGGAAAYERELQRLRADLPGLDDARRTVRVQRLLASVGDGHTLLYPFGMRRGALSRVLLALYWFDDGLYVVGAGDAALVGARVEAIGGQPAAEVLEALRPYVSADNDMQFRWAAPFYATLPELVADAVPGMSPQAALDWRLAVGGGERTVHLAAAPVDPVGIELKLPPPPSPSPPPWLGRREENAWFGMLGDGVVYAQVNAIADGDDESLADFAGRLDAKLRDGARGMVLDLRNDSGGDAGLADRLLATLLAFDLHGGRLVVLASRFTFSAAVTLAARLDAWTAATFVGEPTGSGPNHYGNETPFVLPNTGLRGNISSGWNQPVRSADARVWIAPDVPVALTAADYFAGRDPALERARAIAAESRAR